MGGSVPADGGTDGGKAEEREEFEACGSGGGDCSDEGGVMVKS